MLEVTRPERLFGGMVPPRVVAEERLAQEWIRRNQLNRAPGDASEAALCSAVLRGDAGTVDNCITDGACTNTLCVDPDLHHMLGGSAAGVPEALPLIMSAAWRGHPRIFCSLLAHSGNPFAVVEGWTVPQVICLPALKEDEPADGKNPILLLQVLQDRRSLPEHLAVEVLFRGLSIDPTRRLLKGPEDAPRFMTILEYCVEHSGFPSDIPLERMSLLGSVLLQCKLLGPFMTVLRNYGCHLEQGCTSFVGLFLALFGRPDDLVSSWDARVGLDVLIDHGLRADEPLGDGIDLYPLHLAARHNAVNFIPCLLMLGAKLWQKNKAGLTALDVAERGQSHDATKALRAASRCVDPRNGKILVARYQRFLGVPEPPAPE
mmetsp:Transcript_37719/g.82571  ORF Transcript_37719/g.82571 Transcript_37719/m.82571 type:complete len:375 (+) Transcript_37719:38-1162(+)